MPFLFLFHFNCKRAYVLTGEWKPTSNGVWSHHNPFPTFLPLGFWECMWSQHVFQAAGVRIQILIGHVGSSSQYVVFNHYAMGPSFLYHCLMLLYSLYHLFGMPFLFLFLIHSRVRKKEGQLSVVLCPVMVPFFQSSDPPGSWAHLYAYLLCFQADWSGIWRAVNMWLEAS